MFSIISLKNTLYFLIILSIKLLKLRQVGKQKNVHWFSSHNSNSIE